MTGIPVWWDGESDGSTNMAADECLAAEAVARGGLVVRVYGWSSTTISLGAFQSIADARRCGAIAGLPIVRRPSGGGAIVHGTDITYAAAVPKGHPWGAVPQVLYDAFHGAMAGVLRERGVDASLFASKDRPSALDSPSTDGEPFLCFDRRSPGDLVLEHPALSGAHEPKIMGSAQRRLAAAVLQHGSLLVRRNLDVGSSGRHPGLAECVGGDWSHDAGARGLVEEWLHRVAAALGQPLSRQDGPFCAGAWPGLNAARERFASDRWTSRR
ncbi:MAG: biotin/lipoate A/B protein ligase family protein [Planctomycetia bacterium]